MQRVILVVSPDTEFLQQLRSHLEEGGRYQVTVALSAHEALTLANSNFFEVAIVDGELDDIPVSAFTRDLAALQSELKILVFPPDNNSQHPVLEGLVSNGFLSKPFSGQEIGKALANLFSDQPVANSGQTKIVDDLVKQWLQIPETGGRKAEQILEATSAQSVLIIIKDQLIASAGSTEHGMVTNVTGFLSRYWKEEENSELARFMKLDGAGSEQFLYATKLVSNVVLVMIYPMNTTLQLVRRELRNVKDDFQQHYPTTGELRQDIAKQTLAEINSRNKKLENLQLNKTAISQSEIDLLKELDQESAAPNITAVSQAEEEARKLFEQESRKSTPKPAIDAISQAEIDALKVLEQEPPQPAANPISQIELDAKKIFEQESLKSKPKPAIETISQAELDALKAMEQEPPKPAAAISQAEIDALSALQQQPDQLAATTISQAELDAKKLFEQESMKQKPMTTNGISQAEIDALKAMEQDPPKPADAAISQAEIDALNALQQQPAQPAVNTISQAELDAKRLFEQESMKQKPMTTNGISQAEIDALKAMEQEPPKPATAAISQAEIDALNTLQQQPPQPAVKTISQAELDAKRLFEQESMKQKPSTSNSISQDEINTSKAIEQEPPKAAAAGVAQYELDALQLFHQESMKPTSVAVPSVSEQELADLSKMLEQMPAPDPQPETGTPTEEKKLPEWLNELENTEPPATSTSPAPGSAAETMPTGTPPFVGIDASLQLSSDIPAAKEPLPEIDFKLPWEMEETATEVAAVIADQPIAEPVKNPNVEQPAAVAQPVVNAPSEVQQTPSASFAEVLSAVTPPLEPVAASAVVELIIEPTTSEPPSLKNFRFNYTCVLLPGDRNQFLARTLSEKIGGIMPDIHDDQGWRMTSITIRPQYLLWTVSVPMNVCPHQIMKEVRNLTSNSIFANFPEIAKKKTSNDFWSSKFLAVSGSEPPPANLIFDFVTQAWKTPETATP